MGKPLEGELERELIGTLVDQYDVVHDFYKGLIGRAKWCATRIPENDNYLSVSHEHAEISYADGFAFIHDLGSKNGTFVDKRQVLNDSVILDDLVEIRLGKVTFKVRYGDIDSKELTAKDFELEEKL